MGLPLGCRQLAGAPDADDQPPATAGMIETVVLSSTGVSRPSRKRMSSSATNTFTKRRSLPASSKRRSPKPGWAASRALRTSPTVAPSTATSPAPPVRVRSWVGMRTWSACSSSKVDGVVERVEGRGDRGRRPHVGRDGVDRLEAVAGDVGDDPLVGADDALGGELGQRGDGDAAGGLGEDPLGAGRAAGCPRRSRRRSPPRSPRRSGARRRGRSTRRPGCRWPGTWRSCWA